MFYSNRLIMNPYMMETIQTLLHYKGGKRWEGIRGEERKVKRRRRKERRGGEGGGEEGGNVKRRREWR